MNELNHPFFTVIVPTYNQAQFLGIALDSLIAQIDVDWEAIIVNDGSYDNTRDVMEEYAKKDSRIRLFHKPNGGVASALNEGLRHAKGQWICWLSSDDMFDPRKLAIHRDWIGRYPDCNFFFTYFRLLREATGEIADNELWGPLPEREFQLVGLFYRNYISGISICINREAWLQTGFFDETLRYGQDYDMWLRLLAVHPGRFIPEWTCVSRNHALQGSEVFPQACYYDTAKAIIRFINDHRFEELFPLLDLNDSESMNRALQATLEVATEPSAFIYSLGAHPGLLFRLFEWVWASETKYDNGIKRDVQKIISKRISHTVRQYMGTPFAFLAKVLSAALQLQQPAFQYEPLFPAVVGETYYYVSQSAQRSVLSPLQEYLLKYENLSVKECEESPVDYETVIVLPAEIPLSDDAGEALGKMLQISKRLLQRGCRVLLAGYSNKRLGMVDGILFVGANNEADLRKLLKGFGLAAVLISVSHAGSFRWMKAQRKVVYCLPEGGGFNADAAARALFEMVENAPLQKYYIQIFGRVIKKYGKRVLKTITPPCQGMEK